jgi:hypothetical protein
MAYNRTIMHLKYHIEIINQALRELFSDAAMRKIITANLYQDRLAGQIGHDEYHFDNNAFEKSYAYIEEQRALTIAALQSKDVASAWAAFGRLTHTAQDFYAHSNYVDLWLARHSNGSAPTPSDIDPVDSTLLDNPALRSGKVYLPLEVFSLIKPLKPLILPRLPHNSHAWMNLDSPEVGERFTFAFHAAVKRTRIEFEKTTTGLPREQRMAFVDQHS